MPARLFLMYFILVASVGLATAQSKGITAPNSGPQPGHDWDAFFDKLISQTTSGPLTNSVKRGPLLVETDPLGVTGRRKVKVASPPNSFIEPATKDVLAPSTATD